MGSGPPRTPRPERPWARTVQTPQGARVRGGHARGGDVPCTRSLRPHGPLVYHPELARTLLIRTATLWGPASRPHWSPRALTPTTPGACGEQPRVTGTAPAGSERPHRPARAPAAASGRTRPLRLHGRKPNPAETRGRSPAGARLSLPPTNVSPMPRPVCLGPVRSSRPARGSLNTRRTHAEWTSQ